MENNGTKVQIQFSEYVKLQLHDPSNYWSSQLMCASIASGLCAPMILGLPFLIHNNIIVDASAHTVIDKKFGLNEFYQELQEDHKIMVAKLKMACNDHLIHTQHKFEMVALVDVTTMVQQCIEILAAQQELQELRFK